MIGKKKTNRRDDDKRSDTKRSSYKRDDSAQKDVRGKKSGEKDTRSERPRSSSPRGDFKKSRPDSKDKREYTPRNEERSERPRSSSSRNDSRPDNRGKREYTPRNDDRSERPRSSSSRNDFKSSRPDSKGKREYTPRNDDRSERPRPSSSRGDFKSPRPDSKGKREYTPRNDDRSERPRSSSSRPESTTKRKEFKPFEERVERTKAASPRNEYKTKRSFTKNKAAEERKKNEPVADTEQSFERKPLKKVSIPDKKAKRKETHADKGLIRLNRYLANAGIASRRKADDLIIAGEVTVNGEVITELGFQVNPGDKVKFNGKQLKREQMVYVLLNKPKDYITTTDDPQERKTIMELVKNATKERIYPVGRLDRNTTGLLLLTNDGDLAQRLAHPSNKIKKLYEVTLDKPLKKSDFEKIVQGVELEDGIATVDDLAYVEGESKKIVGIEIHIGRNRIVRRLFESLGYIVEKLDRVIYAGLTKKDLPRGKFRHLTQQELVQLKHINKY